MVSPIRSSPDPPDGEGAAGAAPSLLETPCSDMRLYAARGIPTVMVGTSGIELAHAVDERVRLGEVETLSRTIARVLES